MVGDAPTVSGSHGLKVLWDCATAPCLNSTGQTAVGSWRHESQQSTGCVIKEQMKKKVIHEAHSGPGVGTFSPVFWDRIFSAYS